MNYMKLLGFSDVHTDELALKELKSKATGCDLIVCAGDISRGGRSLKNNCSEINSWGKEVLIVPGNNERLELIDLMTKLFSNIKNIHGQVIKRGSYNFAGIGGGLPSVFKTPLELSEEEIKSVLKKFKGVNNLILVSHAPPYGVLDSPIKGEDIGSRELLKFVKEEKPLMILCGHCHEQGGKEELVGKTRVINLGKHGLIINL